MTNITFIQETNTPQQFDVAIILPSSQLNINNIAIHYRPYMNSINCIYLGIPDDLLVTVGSAKSTLEDIGKLVCFLKIPLLYITNSHLFKSITKEKKVDTTYSNVFEAKVKEIGDRKVIYGVHPGNIFVSPLFAENLRTSLQTLSAIHHGTYTKLLGKAQLNIEVIDSNAIHEALQKLYDLPAITCDIETYSLSHYKAGIATIAFGIDERTAIVTPVDTMPETAKQVREELSKFFSTYKGKVIFHNACYDAKVLKYEFGEWSFENTHCTKIISYLATNNAIDNKLALKSLAQEYLGNWGRDDLDDVSQIPINELLEYNAKDAIATWYVYNKFYPKMVNDNQEQLYLGLFQPSIETIVDIELAGFPMIPEQIQKVKEQLTKVLEENTDILNNSVLIQHFNEYLRLKAQTTRNSKLKTKQIPIEEFAHITFNPNSDQQICTLLFDMFKLPVFSKTKTGNPSTKTSHLKILLQQDISEEHKQVISALIEISAVTILLDTFITAFERGRIVGERSYLHGSFNLTGTVSGRLSSSEPNMQNFPSKGTKYAKVIKKCFAAPEGWVLCGADFDSLEDKISALTTKDHNKCKVYLEGYDGHCLRAYAYFKDQMPDIDPTTAAGINKITDLYPHLRQASKTITFALTYQGTAHTLIKNCKLAPEDAYRIEKEYHTLYAVSDEWVANQLKTAASSGFVDVAFGLRLRTPLLARTVAGARHTPYQAQAEYRTAANALGQSYGMLNTRAATEFWQRVKKAGLQDSIKIISLIHDAIYLLVKADKDMLTWAKTNLLECMAWQELPELKHDQIKLTSTFNLFMPTWADEIKGDLSWEKQLTIAGIPLSQ
jgi:DNA polymerase-1